CSKRSLSRANSSRVPGRNGLTVQVTSATLGVICRDQGHDRSLSTGMAPTPLWPYDSMCHAAAHALGRLSDHEARVKKPLPRLFDDLDQIRARRRRASYFELALGDG